MCGFACGLRVLVLESKMESSEQLKLRKESDEEGKSDNGHLVQVRRLGGRGRRSGAARGGESRRPA